MYLKYKTQKYIYVFCILQNRPTVQMRIQNVTMTKIFFQTRPIHEQRGSNTVTMLMLFKFKQIVLKLSVFGHR